MSDSLNFLSKVICGVEGGGALQNRYADFISNEVTEETIEDAQEQSKAIVNKFMKDLGGKQ